MNYSRKHMEVPRKNMYLFLQGGNTFFLEEKTRYDPLSRDLSWWKGHVVQIFIFFAKELHILGPNGWIWHSFHGIRYHIYYNFWRFLLNMLFLKSKTINLKITTDINGKVHVKNLMFSSLLRVCFVSGTCFLIFFSRWLCFTLCGKVQKLV